MEPERNDKETIRATTLKKGNGYDIPILGGTAIIDYMVWTRDLDQPGNDYKDVL